MSLHAAGVLISGFDESVEATASRPRSEVVVTNHTDAEIYINVLGKQTAGLIFWGQGVDGESIAPGRSRRIGYGAIPRYQDEKEVIVHWWHAVTKDGKRMPGELNMVHVTL